MLCFCDKYKYIQGYNFFSHVLLLSKEGHNFNTIMTTLTSKFDNLYEPQWSCIVGHEGFVTRMTSTPAKLIWFTYGTT